MVATPRLDLELDTIKTFFPVTPPSDLFAKEAMMVVSDNDPYMTMSEAEALQRVLDIEMKVLEGAGHINAESSYGEWPWILEWLKHENGKL